MKKVAILIVIYCFLTIYSENIVASSEEKQETANDLFALYDRQILKGKQELQEKYEKAYREYQDTLSQVLADEAFNEIYDSAEAYQEEQISEIDRQVKALLKGNGEIIEDISEQFYGNFEQLDALDVKYKMNAETASELLLQKNEYVLLSRKEISYNEAEALEKEITEMKSDYDDSVSVATLGDVTNIRFPLNADTYVTSPYGERLDPLNPVTVRFHAGIDLMADANTEVVSLFHGVVLDAGYGELGGYYVRIDHGNGIVSYYCHLNQILVEEGQQVTQYDVIALSGNTGIRTTGPHLHLGVYIDGNSVDPYVLFQKE